MGLTTTSISFKGVTQGQVIEAYKLALPNRRSFISPAINGWVSVYDIKCHHENEWQIRLVADAICTRLSCPAIALAVITSDILCYWVFNEKGWLVDKSCPDNLADVVPQLPAQWQGLLGNPASIAALCGKEVTGESVPQILSKETIFREDNLRELTKLLGIVHADHSDVELFYDTDSLTEEDIPGWKDFMQIKGEE